MKKVVIKLYDNNVIKSYSIVLNQEIKYDGIIVETDLDLENINLAENYKLVNGKLIELTKEEKEKLYIGEIEQNEEINSDLLDLTEIVVSQQRLIDELSKEIKTIKGSEKNDI